MASAALSLVTLAERGSEIRRAMKDGDTGETRAAMLLIPIVDNWECYRSEAGGVDATAWATVYFGNRGKLAALRRRYDAVQRMKAEGYERLSFRLHHDVLTYVTGDTIPADQFKAVCKALRFKTEADGVVLTLNQAKAIVAEVIGKVRRVAKEDPRIAEAVTCIAAHRAALKAKGITPPSLPEWVADAGVK